MNRNECLDKIYSFKKLKDNWDSYGGIALTDFLLGVVEFVIKKLDDNELPDFIAPCSGGQSIQFEWDTDNKSLEIEIGYNIVEYLLGDDEESEDGILFEYEDFNDFNVAKVKEMIKKYIIIEKADLFKDLFKSSYDGVIYNLDDLSIYPDKWKESDLWDFFIECHKEAAWSLYYMDYWSASDSSDIWASQKIRVKQLIDELFKIKYAIDLDRVCPKLDEFEKKFRLPLMKWRWRFHDEVENQC